jgi:hypothetical protein
VSSYFLTCYFTERNAVKFTKKVFGEKDVEAILQRLDRLTRDEALTTAAQTLQVIHGLVQGMRVVTDGEQPVSWLIIRRWLNNTPSRRQSIR